MPMLAPRLAKQLKNAYDEMKSKAGGDFNNWYSGVKKQNEANKVLALANLASTNNSSIKPLLLPRINEGVVCPNCGHRHCGCKYHNPNNITNPDIPILNPDGSTNKDKKPSDYDPTSSPAYKAFEEAFGKAMDEEFQQATPTPTMNISLLIAKGTLTLKWKSDPLLNAIEIATKTSAYFAMCILPIGIPVSGVITTVTNTAASILTPLAQELMTMASNPGMSDFEKFADTIIKQVQTIQWTVIETVPGSPPVTVPYQVKVL